MIDRLWYLVMVPMVYFSVAWCIVWIIIRIAAVLKSPDMPRTLRIFPDGKDPEDRSTGGLPAAIWDAVAMPPVRKHNPILWVFLIVFHVAIALLLLSHLDLLPRINIMSPESRHMIGNGAVGVILTTSVLYFLTRRFFSPVREVSVPQDFLLLLLLFCVFVTGDVISWGNSWSDDGFVMTKQDFGLYLDNLFRFTFADPRQFLSGAHYSVVGTHILLANLFLLVLPFTKIMHVFFAIPMNKLRRG